MPPDVLISESLDEPAIGKSGAKTFYMETFGCQMNINDT